MPENQNITKKNRTTRGRAGHHGHGHHHGPPMAATVGRGSQHGQPVVVVVHRLLLVSLLLLFLFLSRLWYLLCYVPVESFWTILAILFDPLGLKNIF